MGSNVIINSDLIGWSAGTSFTCASVQTVRTADMVAAATKYNGNWHLTKQVRDGRNWHRARCSNPGAITSGLAQAQMRVLVDGVDYAPLIGQVQTLSFLVAGSLPGQYTVALRNDGADRSYLFPFTIDVPGETKLVTHTVYDAPEPGGGWTTQSGPKPGGGFYGEGLRIQLTMVCGEELIGVPGWQSSMKMGLPGQANMALVDNSYLEFTDVRLGLGEVIADAAVLSHAERSRAASVQAERNRYYYAPGEYDRRL